MKTETLRVTWKIIRKAGDGRTKDTYCSYIAKNDKYEHQLKTVEGTKLFDILKKTVCSENERYDTFVLIDGVYYNNKLLYVTNFRTTA